MKKLYLIILVALGLGIVFSNYDLCRGASQADKQKADEFVNKIKETAGKYTTTVDNFNGMVVVKVGDKEEALTLMPGESLKVPKNMPPQKGIVTWKNVTEYENKMMIQGNPLDLRVRWFVENIQTDRVNRVLKELTLRLKNEWDKNSPGKKGPNMLSFYMPGNTEAEKYARVGDIIDQIVSDMGMEKIAPFTNTEWKAKLTTGDERLYKADLRQLAQHEGLIQQFTTLESLVTSSSSSTFK